MSWRQRRQRRRLRAVADQALELMAREALFAADVDWPAARSAVAAAVEAAFATPPEPLAVHRALYRVAKQAGGAHTGMQGPAGESLRPDGGSGHVPAQPPGMLEPPLPSGRLVDGVGVVHLPRCPGGLLTTRRYVAAGAAALGGLAPGTPSGWVVDLRDNGGGSMWPMLAVVAPLLPGGVLGGFVRPGGQRSEWTRTGRRILLDGRRMATSQGPGELPRGDRVAVLLSGRTASSGEAVAVAFDGCTGVRSFGAPTFGFTSANRTHRLRDGSLLHLTTSRFADGTGRVYDGPVRPDEPAADDATLAAALDWVRGQAG